MMRLSVAVLIATLVTGSLVACSNGYGVPPTASIFTDNSAQTHVKVLPVELRSSEILAKMRAGTGIGQADAVTFGIYAVASMSVVNAYPFNDRSNGPPVCSVGPFNDLRYSDIAVDRNGDLLVADEGANTITIFKGPGLCGPKLGSVANPFGTSFQDVASRDGQTIVAAYDKMLAKSFVPGVTVCTLSGGCTRNLHLGLGPGFALGVAVAPNGDCWASANSIKYSDVLVYFAHCRGNGVVATGLANDALGGLDIDANGNLVSIAYTSPSDLRIYSGCNPACTSVGGPFPLKSTAEYGHLDESSNKFIASEGTLSYGKLDVYSYSPSAVTYLYSITNGLTRGDYGVAFSPSSKE